MLKRIHLHDLTIGMYLHEFCGSWMDHPFWRTKFLIKDADDLARIQATAIHDCWIDTDKGLDVASGIYNQSSEEVSQQIEAELSQMGDLPEVAFSLPPPSVPQRNTAPASMQDELQRAAALCMRSKQAVMEMFNEARMGHVVDTVGAQTLVDDISDSLARNPCALISLARLKTADDYTYMHSVAVSALMVALARQVKLPEEQVRLAGMAGLLHDMGKAAVPQEILNKPGKLTDDEFAQIRRHPGAGYAILKKSGRLSEHVLDACLHHHEKIDGSGYPDRLKGDEISVIARMVAICDVYDAITSDRPYKNGWDPAQSLRRMAEWTMDHFDPRLFQALVKSIGIYPVGSLVRLSSGRIGVVTEQVTTALTQPQVKVFFSTKSDLRIPPETIQLSAPGCTEKIEAREDPEKWGFPDLHELCSGLTGKVW